MGIFSKRPHPNEDRHIEEGKRIWNAGRKRSDRIK